jgi:hypothetical protein
MGAYGLTERTIAQLHRRSPEALREQLWSDEWLQLGLDGFKTRLANAERDAVRCFFEAIELVGSRDDAMLLAFLAGSGARDAEHARLLIARASSVEGVSDVDVYRMAKELVRARIMADPDERRRAMQEIFGLMDASETGAAKANGGNGNGSRNAV